jgi:hypothetical protein
MGTDKAQFVLGSLTNVHIGAVSPTKGLIKPTSYVLQDNPSLDA